MKANKVTTEKRTAKELKAVIITNWVILVSIISTVVFILVQEIGKLF